MKRTRGHGRQASTPTPPPTKPVLGLLSSSMSSLSSAMTILRNPEFCTGRDVLDKLRLASDSLRRAIRTLSYGSGFLEASSAHVRELLRFSDGVISDVGNSLDVRIQESRRKNESISASLSRLTAALDAFRRASSLLEDVGGGDDPFIASHTEDLDDLSRRVIYGLESLSGKTREYLKKDDARINLVKRETESSLNLLREVRGEILARSRTSDDSNS